MPEKNSPVFFCCYKALRGVKNLLPYNLSIQGAITPLRLLPNRIQAF